MGGRPSPFWSPFGGGEVLPRTVPVVALLALGRGAVGEVEGELLSGIDCLATGSVFPRLDGEIESKRKSCDNERYLGS